MPTPLFKQISLWKQQEQTPTHPMSYKFLHDEESSSEKGSVQTLNNDDIRPSPRLHERILFGILIFVIIVLSGLLIDSHRRIQASPPPKPKSPVPDFPLKPVLFDYSPTYESGPGSDELWEAVIPAGGLIAIKHPEQYNLKKGLPTIIPDAQIFGVSVTHQFHCLKMLRTTLQSYIYGTGTNRSTIPPPHHHHHLNPQNPQDPMPRSITHIFHCMDYLRQTILCNADTTIEWEALTVDERRLPTGHIDGYGVVHQCRDWDQVRSWMKSQLPPDEKFLKPQ